MRRLFPVPHQVAHVFLALLPLIPISFVSAATTEQPVGSVEDCYQDLQMMVQRGWVAASGDLKSYSLRATRDAKKFFHSRKCRR